MGGIAPTSGGFATFDIKPVTQGLEYAEAIVPTAKGLVESSWVKTDDHNLKLEVTIPANTVAHIFVPDNNMEHITVKEGGVTVFSDGVYIPGVSGIRGGVQEGDYIVFEVGSGNYAFTATGVSLHSSIPGK